MTRTKVQEPGHAKPVLDWPPHPLLATATETETTAAIMAAAITAPMLFLGRWCTTIVNLTQQ